MNTQKKSFFSWRTGLFAISLFLGFLLLRPASTQAAISCGDSLGPGGPYVLTSDLSCSGPGLYLTGPAILDLRGHTIDCDGYGPGITISGRNAIVTNGRVTNCALGIQVSGSGGDTITRMEVDHGYSGTGILIETGGDDAPVTQSIILAGNRIQGNYIHDNPGDGMDIGGFGHNQVTNNRFENNRDGVYDSSDFDQYTGNVFTDTSGDAGIYLTGDHNFLTGNVSNSNRYGFWISDNGSFNTINSNTAKNNYYDGIRVEGESNTINGNVATGNATSGDPGNYDLYDGNYLCDSNIWNANTFGTANDSCIH